MHEFSIDDAVAHEWSESELAHAELLPWFKSSMVDPFNGESDAPLRSALLRRVVSDCERAGSVLKRSRSGGSLLTPRNRSPSFGSRSLLPPGATPGSAVASGGNNASGATAAAGGGTLSTAPTPASPPYQHVTSLQASGEGELDASMFGRAHDLTIEDSESDLDDAFDAVGDISSRFVKASMMRSPRRLSARGGVPMLTLQALQSLATPASALGGVSIAASSSNPRKTLHRRSDSDDLSSSHIALPTPLGSAAAPASRSAPRLVVPPTPIAQVGQQQHHHHTTNHHTTNHHHNSIPSTMAVHSPSNSGSVPASAAVSVPRSRPVVASSAAGRRMPRSRVDATDFSAYSDVGRMRLETPLYVAAAPQFVSLATGGVERAHGDYWAPDTPYRPRPGESLRAPSHETVHTAAAVVAAAAAVGAASMPGTPPFIISRTGEWLKSN